MPIDPIRCISRVNLILLKITKMRFTPWMIVRIENYQNKPWLKFTPLSNGWKKSGSFEKNQKTNLIISAANFKFQVLANWRIRSPRISLRPVRAISSEYLPNRIEYVPNEILYPMNLVWAKSVDLPNTNQRRKWDFFDSDQQYNNQEQDAIDLKWENWQNKWDQLNFLTFFNWNGIKCYVEHALRV